MSGAVLTSKVLDIPRYVLDADGWVGIDGIQNMLQDRFEVLGVVADARNADRSIAPKFLVLNFGDRNVEFAPQPFH